jgi:membrane protein YdbS with pleckstrin-like domain
MNFSNLEKESANPPARRTMERWGLAWGITAIIGLWLLVVLVTYVPMWFASAWMQWLTAGMGFFIAWCQ